MLRAWWKRVRNNAGRTGRAPARPSFVPRLEGLEDRVVPSLTAVPASWAGNSPFNGIVSLTAKFNDVGTFVGSGAFIDATHILTAAHVIYDLSSHDNNHFADQVQVRVGRDGGNASYDGRVYYVRTMTTDGLYNGVFGDNDIAVLTLDPNGGYPAHTNFGLISNADRVGYGNLPLHSVGYPADTYWGSGFTGANMYQTSGYAEGIDTRTDWFAHTPLIYWHNTPASGGNGLSLYIGGQSGSPVLYQDSQGHLDVIGVFIGSSELLNSSGQPIRDYNGNILCNPNGTGYATAMTATMANFVEGVLNGGSGGSQRRVAVGDPQPAATSVSLAASATTVAPGARAVFTATVSSPAGAPTGYVSFYDGSTYLGQAALQGGTAYFTTSSLTPGTHSISAVYAGDSSHLASRSAAVSVRVAPAASQYESRALSALTAGYQYGYAEYAYGSHSTYAYYAYVYGYYAYAYAALASQTHNATYWLYAYEYGAAAEANAYADYAATGNPYAYYAYANDYNGYSLALDAYYDEAR